MNSSIVVPFGPEFWYRFALGTHSPEQNARLSRLLTLYPERLAGAVQDVELPSGEKVERYVYSPRSLRATTATLLLNSVVAIEEAQDPFDHEHITTTQIYDKRRRGVRDSTSHKVPISGPCVVHNRYRTHPTNNDALSPSAYHVVGRDYARRSLKVEGEPANTGEKIDHKLGTGRLLIRSLAQETDWLGYNSSGASSCGGKFSLCAYTRLLINQAAQLRMKANANILSAVPTL
jgi:hypothetical protein